MGGVSGNCIDVNGAELSGCIHCESTPQVVLVMLMLAAVEMV